MTENVKIELAKKYGENYVKALIFTSSASATAVTAPFTIGNMLSLQD